MGSAPGESCCLTVQACTTNCPYGAAPLLRSIKADLGVHGVRWTEPSCKPHFLVSNNLSLRCFQLAYQPQ